MQIQIRTHVYTLKHTFAWTVHAINMEILHTERKWFKMHGLVRGFVKGKAVIVNVFLYSRLLLLLMSVYFSFESVSIDQTKTY